MAAKFIVGNLIFTEAGGTCQDPQRHLNLFNCKEKTKKFYVNLFTPLSIL